ncbi:hypothetical protein ABW18_18710 [Gordonia jacobaea]|uniref:Uncharacterized protein n=1 Tax=Gordonia jacobaea TaxID=122202 RepID=A0ABR5I7Z1_9ACTN|nr:hypothetical protein ABW18_18710 [Gordonia jacobaea]
MTDRPAEVSLRIGAGGRVDTIGVNNGVRVEAVCSRTEVTASMSEKMRRLAGRDPDSTCRCGHPRAAHEHFRSGTDCAICGPEKCPRFRRAWSRQARPAE